MTVPELTEGVRLELVAGAVAHGGHCVARHEGLVVFVRHCLPGERVLAEVTEVRRGYLRADAVAVLDAAPDRVTPACPHARPDACGGCDLQHVAAPAQRRWKTAVVREQLLRLGRLRPDEIDQLAVRVTALPAGPGTEGSESSGDGLGWRTRVRYAVDAAGRAGLLKHRSHQVVPIDYCRIAHPGIQALPVTRQSWPRADEVLTVAPAIGPAVARPAGEPATVNERALGREWTLPIEAFWQVHPAAPDTLASAVLELLEPGPGETAWDLYGGVGLFAAALAPYVRAVTMVESSHRAVTTARANLADLASVSIMESRVELALRRHRLAGPVDLVVLDPPRAGAGAAVVRAIMAAGPRAVAYVACDPAAFARDVRTFGEGGWRLAPLRAYDCFPNTHHVESVGRLVPGSAPAR